MSIGVSVYEYVHHVSAGAPGDQRQPLSLELEYRQ